MASCKSCSKAITWAETITGRASPFEVDANGLWVLDGGKARRRKDEDRGPFYTSHFATCPQAKQWRSKQ